MAAPTPLALAPAAQAVRSGLALPAGQLPFLDGGAATLLAPEKDGQPVRLLFALRIALSLSSGCELRLELPLGLRARLLAQQLREAADACDRLEARVEAARQAVTTAPPPASALIDLSAAPSSRP